MFSSDQFKTDITNDFINDLKNLQQSELIKSRFFKLADGISAIPLMDSRIDTGIAHIIAPYNHKTNLPGINLVALFDQLLDALNSFLNGKMLHQTVFSNHYISNIQELKNPILKLFCEMLLFNISKIKYFVCDVGLFFEEDFQSDLQGVKLLDEVPDGFVHLFEQLNGFGELLERRSLDTLAKENLCLADSDLYNQMEKLLFPLETKISVQILILKAIIARLELLQLFSMTWEAVFFLDMPKLQKIAARVLSNLNLIDNSTDIPTDEIKKEMEKSFDVSLHRLLFPQHPLRKIEIVGKNGIKGFIQMFEQIIKLDGLYHIGFDALLYGIFDFSFRFYKTNILTRSILYAFSREISQTVDCSIKLHLNIPYLCSTESESPIAGNSFYQSTNPEVIRKTLTLLKQISDTFEFIFKTFCLNRPRQRRQLSNTLETMADLLKYSIDMEHQIQHIVCSDKEFMISNWLSYQKTNLERLFIEIGFEIGLYAPFEYAFIYLNLNNSISHSLKIKSQIQFLKDREIIVDQTKTINLEGGLGDDKSENKYEEWITENDLYLQLLENMSMISFQLCCLVKRSVAKYTNNTRHYQERLAYQNRFQVLAVKIDYKDYKPIEDRLLKCDRSVIVGSVLDIIEIAIKSAKKLSIGVFKRISLDLARICVVNRLVLTTNREEIDLEFKYHSHFPNLIYTNAK